MPSLARITRNGCWGCSKNRVTCKPIATVVYHVQPFMLVGLGVLFFAERLSAARVGWLLLAFAGLMLIVSAKGRWQATGADYVLGVCLALASAFFYAVAAAITQRLKDLPAHLIVLIQRVVGVLVLAPFVDFSRVDTVEGHAGADGHHVERFDRRGGHLVCRER